MNHLTEEQLVLYHYGDAGDGAEHGGDRGAPARVRVVPGRPRRAAAGRWRRWTRCRCRTGRTATAPSVWARIQPSLGRDAGDVAGAAARRLLVAAAARAGRRGRRPRWCVGGVRRRARVPSPWHGARRSRPAVRRRRRLRRRPPQPTAADRERVQANGCCWWRSAITSNGRRWRSSNWSTPPAGRTVDISDEQQRARDLVTENRLYRQTALTTGEPGGGERARRPRAGAGGGRQQPVDDERRPSSTRCGSASSSRESSSRSACSASACASGSTARVERRAGIRGMTVEQRGHDHVAKHISRT